MQSGMTMSVCSLFPNTRESAILQVASGFDTSMHPLKEVLHYCSDAVVCEFHFTCVTCTVYCDVGTYLCSFVTIGIN